MPSTVLRTVAGTARAATDIAIAAAVQASDMPISTPRADHDADKAMRARHQRQARDIQQRADHHDRAKAEPHRHRAGERLQESPGQVLHRDRQGEVGNGDADVVGQRLQEDAERLAQAHAQA